MSDAQISILGLDLSFLTTCLSAVLCEQQKAGGAVENVGVFVYKT